MALLAALSMVALGDFIGGLQHVISNAGGAEAVMPLLAIKAGVLPRNRFIAQTNFLKRIRIF